MVWIWEWGRREKDKKGRDRSKYCAVHSTGIQGVKKKIYSVFQKIILEKSVGDKTWLLNNI